MVVSFLTQPEVVTALGIGAAVASAAAYSHFTGNEASVDTDGDGEDELTFGGDEPNETATSTAVGPEIGPDTLEDITGVGPVRAEDLRAAGFDTPADVYYASDENLKDVHGIGPLAVEQIRGDIGGVDYEDDTE